MKRETEATLQKIDNHIMGMEVIAHAVECLDRPGIEFSMASVKPAIIVKTPRDFLAVKRYLTRQYGRFPLNHEMTFDCASTGHKIDVWDNHESNFVIWFEAPINISYSTVEVLNFFETVYEGSSLEESFVYEVIDNGSGKRVAV